jgi:protein SCO1/2
MDIVRRAAVVLATVLAIVSVRGQAPAVEPPADIGIDEKLGAMVPMDLAFHDENGAPFVFKDGIRKPTLLLLVFYHCPVSCGIMLNEMAEVLKAMPLKAGEDYQAVTVSFDDEDRAEDAARRKTNHATGFPPSFPLDQWKFLWGDETNIRRLKEAVGYKCRKQGSRDFVHPNAMMALAPDGKVIRYIYGPDFQPFVVSMALTEAARGTPGVSIRKMMSYCFSYDAKGKRYVLSTLRLAGGSVLVGVGLFVVFLTRKRKPGTRT